MPVEVIFESKCCRTRWTAELVGQVAVELLDMPVESLFVVEKPSPWTVRALEAAGRGELVDAGDVLAIGADVAEGAATLRA